MNEIQYGDWKIAIDLEKTKEYYSTYVIPDTQANRNFAEYCKNLTEEEKRFFDSFGIVPECCELECIGANKKKEFPCGGYYYVFGSYLERPEEEIMAVDELADNNSEEEQDNNTVNIGIFEFDFQCEDFVFNIIPEDMPEGAICIRFWCEDMKWLLPEKPEIVMYEPPKFWEIRKIIKEKQEIKRQEKEMFDEIRQDFKNAIDSLGIQYTELSSKEIKSYKQKWIDEFTPENADKKAITKLCLSTKKYTTFLWHIFSFEFLESETESCALYDSMAKSECLLINNTSDIGFMLENAEKLTSEVLENFIDVTVFPTDYSWTYCKTHEGHLGPYFYKK